MAGAEPRTVQSASKTSNDVPASPVAIKHEQPVRETVAITTLTLPTDSDLVLVETRFSAPPADEQPPEAPRRRVRAARAAILDEPLQIVETRKHDGG